MAIRRAPEPSFGRRASHKACRGSAPPQRAVRSREPQTWTWDICVVSLVRCAVAHQGLRRALAPLSCASLAEKGFGPRYHARA
eukprot:scaffold56081_cov27-Tisochrysis_lutea.AAC.3